MTIDLEQLQKAMDSFGDQRMRVEGLSAEKQTLVDQILMKYPEVRNELEEVDDEFDDKIKSGEEDLKRQRKVLDSMIAQYLRSNPVGDKDVISSDFMSLTATAVPEWDTEMLDKMITQDGKTELLGARKEKIKTVLRLKSM